MYPSYYKEYYSLEREHWWFRVRAKIITDRLSRMMRRGQNQVLNIGAATCRTSELLEEFGNVTSVEYDQQCCDFVRTELKRPIINGSILNLPFANDSFDLVCAFDVIEHVEDDQEAVAEMIRVCRPGGLIAITVPAFMNLWSHHDVVNRHFRRYTSSELISLFEDKCGTIIYHSFFNTILFIPIYLFRRTAHLIPNTWIRRGAGSDNTVFKRKSALNLIPYSLFKLEILLLRIMRFPLGVSILFGFRKG